MLQLYILGLTNIGPSYNIIYQNCVIYENFMIYNSVGSKMANSKKQRTNNETKKQHRNNHESR